MLYRDGGRLSERRVYDDGEGGKYSRAAHDIVVCGVFFCKFLVNEISKLSTANGCRVELAYDRACTGENQSPRQVGLLYQMRAGTVGFVEPELACKILRGLATVMFQITRAKANCDRGAYGTHTGKAPQSTW